jgi:hypothetical protein
VLEQCEVTVITNLANNLRWLCAINRSKILLHGCIIIASLVQEVTVLAVDGILLQRIDANLLRKVDCKNVEIALIKNLELLLEALFPIAEDLKRMLKGL